MISINNVTVTFSGNDLFQDISFVINPKDRIGLTGKNGAGKSTLLKTIVGIQPVDKGSVTIPNGVTIGYLPQQMELPEGRTVMEEALTCFEDAKRLEEEINSLSAQIATRTDYESESYMSLIHRMTEATERLELLGGSKREAETEVVLKGLGFRQTDFTRQTSEFSGGWKMRIILAKVILRKPNVFLLDEPTNHLDIESIQWLEDFLKDYPGAVVLISHDRTFLDNVTRRTIEISLGKIYDYNAPYTKYLELRKERRQQQIAAYENQQKIIKDTEDFIEKFRYKPTKSNQVQSRIKMLDKMERLSVDLEDNSSIHFKFPPAPRSGQIVVKATHFTKAFGEKVILKDIDFQLERGEKVAFVGRNGEGKTTFSRCIIGQLPYDGELKLGYNVSIGYYAQNQDELLDLNKTVFQTLDDIATGDMRTKVRDILGAFLFGGEDIEKKVKVLSGGERARLEMAKLLFEPYSLLVLDEPTNHLDIRSKEILKQALLKYDGTLILVSHDRDFLHGLADTVYEFRDQKIKQYKGDITYFLEKLKLQNMKEFELQKSNNNGGNNSGKVVGSGRDGARTVSTSAASAATSTTTTAPQMSSSKEDYLQRKERERILRKLKSNVEKSEARIAELEAQQEELQQKLSLPEKQTDMSLFEQYEELKIQLEKEMAYWEDATMQYEEAGGE
ncbi:MAG: ABC-F family ATP-binding cassette domain-containing protein [Bacteroidales bacterium]|nr:ABC-F family ATP-binding cassette domain-containing protein [Bacteroidales bacterium]